jgi:L-aspartate oxidase
VVGEAGCTGVHGANRLASNSLLDALVTGRRAAEAIRNRPTRASDFGPTSRPMPSLPSAAAGRLRGEMARFAGVERDADGLIELLDTIESLEREHGPADTLITARFVAGAALLREESRGAHARSDHPLASAPVTHTELSLERLEKLGGSRIRNRGAA